MSPSVLIVEFALFLPVLFSFRVKKDTSSDVKSSLIQNIVNGVPAAQTPFFIRIEVPFLQDQRQRKHNLPSDFNIIAFVIVFLVTRKKNKINTKTKYFFIYKIFLIR